MRARGARSRHPHAGSPRTGSTARGGPTCAIGGSLMCSDARIDTSGATDLSIRATRSSTFCHGAVPQDAADEGFIMRSGPIIIGHAAEFDAGSRAWAWEPYIESVLARQRQVPNDLAPVTTIGSPEGIRTPDLFLEREAPWTTRRPGRRTSVYASHS